MVLNMSMLTSYDQQGYSKFQYPCIDRVSSSSSNASTGSLDSNEDPNKRFKLISQMSQQVLVNTLQQNITNNTDMSVLDDSLTNLNWLHNVNPVKINEQLVNTNPYYTAQQSYQPRNRYNFNRQCSNYHNIANITLTQHPDYKHNPSIKPPFSYAILISWAMKEIGRPKITLSDIYNWIMDNFAYYRFSDSSWQNSVRHNLSLGKCFEKVPRRKDERGKGGFWRINPQYSKTLDINLSKVKYNPNSTTEYTPINPISLNNVNPVNLVSPSKSERDHATLSSTIIAKKSRKSPITVTQENWENIDENLINIDQKQSNITELSNTNQIVQSPIGYSSDSTFTSLDTPDEFEFIDGFNTNSEHNSDDNFDSILQTSILGDKNDMSIGHNTCPNEFNELFNPNKDDLFDLNNLFGI